MRRIIDSHAHIGRYGQWDCDPGLLLSQMDAAGIRLHMELRSDHSRAIQLISEDNNLYGDTPFVSTEDTARAIEICGAKKIMFGTDAPAIGTHSYDSLPFMKKVLENRFGAGTADSIFCKNCERLLLHPV